MTENIFTSSLVIRLMDIMPYILDDYIIILTRLGGYEVYKPEEVPYKYLIKNVIRISTFRRRPTDEFYPMIELYPETGGEDG